VADARDAAASATTTAPAPGARWVPVAEVARPHGVRGELRLKLYNLGSDLLRRRSEVMLRLKDGSERAASIAAARPANKALLVELRGIDDRDGADALRGAVICVSRADFPPALPGEFYACDLEGARAVLPNGDEVGRVRGLRSYPTCDALEIERGSAGILEVPLVDSYVDEVDVEAGLIRLRTLEGL
jgi:16S rRNA processing protein RimM